MAKAQARDEVIACPYLGAGEATEVLLAVATSEYRTVSASATRIQFARSYRPVWSLTLGFLLLPVVIGIPFLLIKSTETWAAFVEEDHRKVQVRVTGSIMSSVLLALHEELACAPASAVPASSGSYALEVVNVPSMGNGGVPGTALDGSVSDPTQFAPRPAGESQPSPAVDGLTTPLQSTMTGFPGSPGGGGAVQSTGPTWTPPDLGVRLQPEPPIPAGTPVVATRSVPTSAEGLSQSHQDETIVRKNGRAVGSHHEEIDDATTLAALVARFDTGERVALKGSIFVGRDPESPDAEEDSTFVPIDDADRSVSKTHLVLRYDGRSASIEDLGSTNGTVVVDPSGVEHPVEPGHAVALPEGSVVNFGDRSFRMVREPVRGRVG